MADSTPSVTREQVLQQLECARHEKDDSLRNAQFTAIIEGGASYERHIRDIVLDGSVDFYTRRFALRVGTGFRNRSGSESASYDDFIRKHLIAGRNKGALVTAYENGEDPDGARIGLYVTGEDILKTPDFYEKYVLVGKDLKQSQSAKAESPKSNAWPASLKMSGKHLAWGKQHQRAVDLSDFSDGDFNLILDGGPVSVPQGPDRGVFDRLEQEVLEIIQKSPRFAAVSSCDAKYLMGMARLKIALSMAVQSDMDLQTCLLLVRQ